MAISFDIESAQFHCAHFIITDDLLRVTGNDLCAAALLGEFTMDLGNQVRYHFFDTDERNGPVDYSSNCSIQGLSDALCNFFTLAARGLPKAVDRRPISERTRLRVLVRANCRCSYCGKQSNQESLVIDHVLPLAKRGMNDIDNLVAACDTCNNAKNALTLEELRG